MDKWRRFKHLRYGLFIHFGLYALLGGEYKGQQTPFLAEWIRLSLNIPDDIYRDLANRFNPHHFDADAICQFAKENGMRYLCFTAKHHDGFALFDSQADRFNSVKSAANRDFVKELSTSAKDHGLAFCLYYSQAQDWDHPGGKRAYQEQPSNTLFQQYLNDKCLPQIEELLSHYGPIAMLWLDTPIDMTKEDSMKITALVHRLQPSCLISGRVGHGLGDYITTGDNRMPKGKVDRLWEMPVSLYDSWGYKHHDAAIKSSETLLRLLTKAVGRGGNLLVNVGPDGDGKIPKAALRVLSKTGDFLSIYKEAYDAPVTVPDYPYEEDGFLLLAASHRLFVHVLAWPENDCIELYHVENEITKIRELGSKRELDFLQGQDLEGHAYVRIDLKKAQVELKEAIERFGMAVIELSLREEEVHISRLT